MHAQPAGRVLSSHVERIGIAHDQFTLDMRSEWQFKETRSLWFDLCVCLLLKVKYIISREAFHLYFFNHKKQESFLAPPSFLTTVWWSKSWALGQSALDLNHVFATYYLTDLQQLNFQSVFWCIKGGYKCTKFTKLNEKFYVRHHAWHRISTQ